MIPAQVLLYGMCVILSPKANKQVLEEHAFFKCKQQGVLYDLNGGFFSASFSCVRGNRSFLIDRKDILITVECKEENRLEQE